MSRLAVIFAGQGSQYPSMGQDFFNETLYKKAKEILGYDPNDIIKSNDNRLNQTNYTQPLVFYTSSLIYDAVKTLNPSVEGFLGFSLGEYSSLCGAGVYTFEDTLKLIVERANLMEEETQKTKGAMAACIGLEDKEIDQLLKQSGLDVYVANYNTDLQTVISGNKEDIEKAITLLKDNGLKRAVMLNVSGAFHSNLMKQAGVKLRKTLESVKPTQISVLCYMNVTNQPLELNELNDLLEKQVYSSVRFKQSIETMKKDGFTHFIEIGPGTTLSAFIKKIDPSLEVISINQKEDLISLERWLNEHEFRK